jgi:CBS domain-containing protein
MSLKETIKNLVKTGNPSVTATTSVKKAIELMARDGGSALAVTMNDEVTGVVTDLDLAGAIIRGGNPESLKVTDCMTACELITGKGAKNPCVQLDEDESVENALKLLESTGVHNLMVSGPGNRFLGLVSAGDLLKAAVN